MDGIRESILAAKDTKFTDNAIPDFNQLPFKIVLVHNGLLKSNTRKTFDDFISREFPQGGFERWGIYELTDLFSNHLFSEYLLTDQESIRLFKRTLVLLDAPDYDFTDFKILINSQINNISQIKGRAFKKFFATLNLISVIILHYSKENDNLYPAKECVTFLLLRTWSWILKSKIEDKNAVLKEYRKLLKIHFDIYTLYFEKTLSTAIEPNGLFAEHSGPFEAIGYPVRSFDYLNDLIYYFKARLYWPNFDKEPSEIKKAKLYQKQKDVLKQLVRNNDGCARPLLDNHSIAIVNTILFFLDKKHIDDEDLTFIAEYIQTVFDNVLIIKLTRDRFPELYNNLQVLTEYVATSQRPYNYEDSSSLLVTMLFEILAVLNASGLYSHYKTEIEKLGKNLNLQIAYPTNGVDVEQLLFDKHMHMEMYVETNIHLPEKFKDFKSMVKGKPVKMYEYRTDKAGFPFLRTLAHTYFKNEPFAEEWRSQL